MPTARPHSVRMRGLDGLRTIAVGVVLGYHLLPRLVPGGVVGVDVFFVISGFLITSLLLTERRRTGRIDIARFWLRRLRRLVPAVTLMVMTVTALAAMAGGDILVGIRRQVLGALTFSYNWVEIAHGSSYFDHTRPALLTNMWSLAVEEQFYIFWPPVIVLLLGRRLTRCSRFMAAGMTAVLAVFSVGWAWYLTQGGTDPSRVYMGTDTHAYGLMIGSALALADGWALDAARRPTNWLARAVASCHHRHDADATTPLALMRVDHALVMGRGIIGWAGLAGIVMCALNINALDPGMVPWGLATGSLCAAAVVQALIPSIAARRGPGRALIHVLDHPVLTWLGARSYGIYLWHWPLWVLAFSVFKGVSGPWWAALLILLSVLIADLSYRFVEVPMRKDGFVPTLRRWRTLSSHQTMAALAAGATAVVCVAGAGLAAQPERTSVEELIESGAQAVASAEASTPETSTAPPAVPAPTPASSIPSPDPVQGDEVSIVGDSVTLASAGALTEKLPGVAIDAAVSRSMLAAMDVLKGLDAAYGARPYVVIALATNGTVDREQLNEILNYLGKDRRLVLVTGYAPDYATWVPPADQTIRDFATEYPQQVRVASWDNVIVSHLEFLADDEIHPGPEGGELYAAGVVEALNSF
ncbi:acyltransferase family protein [Actinomyces vulturis]|uniref:acyltransferase family protein n=1 Tax=Actinomyces vulturis TaxID=1857645 RepID=UPI000833B7DE|nr:acyltransferase family protein [Actinomyces vulturis]